MRFQTDRLILRPWLDADRGPYADMMADPQVGSWLGSTLTAEQANAHIDRSLAELAASGSGWLAIERRADGAFLGAALMREIPANHPLGGEIEVGWRLARRAWGEGYATEAARAVLADGFSRLGPSRIVAFTAVTNTRSRAVMERLGMAREASMDFDHPALAADHPMRAHVVYAISKDAR